MTDRDLMLRFCSLGGNCEFGFAQREFGAEPIDLLRWAATPYPRLLQLLAARFADIGKPDELSVNGEGGAMMIHHAGLGLHWHAFPAKNATWAQIHARDVKRLPFLARKLTDDLTAAERIFVYRPLFGATITLDLAQELLDAMDTFGGAPRLLVVHDGADAPVIEAVHARIMFGRIVQFADQRAVPATTRAADWLALCRAAIDALVTSHQMALPAA